MSKASATAAEVTAKATMTATPAEAPSIGRIVHYVNPGGECQAAIISALTVDPVRVHLTVFSVSGGAASWRDISLDAGNSPGTWHWPERV